jgi:hypothetical protein
MKYRKGGRGAPWIATGIEDAAIRKANSAVRRHSRKR